MATASVLIPGEEKLLLSVQWQHNFVCPLSLNLAS